MLERVQREGNTPTLLVGMQIGTVTMENIIEVPLKIELSYDPIILLMGIYPEKNIICTPIFIKALFMIAKTWKKLNVHQQKNG